MENDQELLEHIFYSYRKQMVALAMSILHDTNDAEDAVGTVLLHIASKKMTVVSKINSETDLRNYLLKSVKNTALNMIRDNKETVLLEDVEESVNCPDSAFLDLICSKMEYEEVLAAIEALDEKYRLVLHYHFVSELSVPETAKLLGQSVVTTKKQLIRGKKKLLALLGIKGGVKHVNQ